MPIATFRGERNISDIADHLFAKLTDNQRKKVAEQLLKANPQLRDIRKMKKGAILRVPDMPELNAKTTRSLENPGEQMAEVLADALKGFEERVQKQMGEESKNIESQLSLLKSDKFQGQIANSDILQLLAKDSAEVLKKRTQELKQQNKEVDIVIEQGMEDLKKMMK